MVTYSIVRFFQNRPNEVVATGLTLMEAQAHCSRSDTASDTATDLPAQRYTAEVGPWFDGYVADAFVFDEVDVAEVSND